MAKPIVHGVKERPILFSGAMVRALLDGSKSQTRRIVKGQAPEWQALTAEDDVDGDEFFMVFGNAEPSGMHPILTAIRCPYGQPGDRLWCRETWQALHKYNGSKISDIPEVDRHWVNYPADGNTWDARQRAARFMPRWASRILLEIVNVRVERLQEISEADARAEGASASGWQPSYSNPDNAGCHESISAVENYADLWESLNGPGSWDANPFVWAIEFRRIGGTA